jgi:hypothetical protein
VDCPHLQDTLFVEPGRAGWRADVLHLRVVAAQRLCDDATSVFNSVTTVPAAGFAVVAAILGDWDVAAQS